MFYENLKLNYLAIIICIVINVIIAILWYMPFLFGKIWSGITNQSIDGPPDPKNLIIGIICGIIFVFTIAILLKSINVQSVGEGITFGLLIGIGIIASINLPVNIYNGQNLTLFFIDSGLSLFSIIINSIILTLMK